MCALYNSTILTPFYFFNIPECSKCTHSPGHHLNACSCIPIEIKEEFKAIKGKQKGKAIAQYWAESCQRKGLCNVVASGWDEAESRCQGVYFRTKVDAANILPPAPPPSLPSTNSAGNKAKAIAVAVTENSQRRASVSGPFLHAARSLLTGQTQAQASTQRRSSLSGAIRDRPHTDPFQPNNSDGFKTPVMDSSSSSFASAPRATVPVLPGNVYHRPVLKVKEDVVRSAGTSLALPLFQAQAHAATSAAPTSGIMSKSTTSPNNKMAREIMLQTRYARLATVPVLPGNVYHRPVLKVKEDVVRSAGTSLALPLFQAQAHAATSAAPTSGIMSKSTTSPNNKMARVANQGGRVSMAPHLPVSFRRPVRKYTTYRINSFISSLVFSTMKV